MCAILGSYSAAPKNITAWEGVSQAVRVVEMGES